MMAQSREPARVVRGVARTNEIVAATLELLGELGYERLTIDAVADRIGASKATIYRRWGDKRELVCGALVARSAEHPELPATAETLRDDLIALIRLVAGLAVDEDASGFASLLAAALRDPVIAEAVGDQALRRRRTDCRDVVQRAIGRGELTDPRQADVLFELVMGRVLTGAMLRLGAGFTEQEQIRFVDAVLLPVLHHGAAAGTPTADDMDQEGTA